MILHGYRHDYHLNTPAAFNSAYNQLVLARSPIGKFSPTMARRKEERRQSKEQLANAVRKHFNSMGIVENEVVVDFLYKVRWQGSSPDPNLNLILILSTRQELPHAVRSTPTSITFMIKFDVSTSMTGVWGFAVLRYN